MTDQSVADSIADTFAALETVDLSIDVADVTATEHDLSRVLDRVAAVLDHTSASVAATIDRVLHPPRRVVIRWPERRHLTRRERQRRTAANRAARAARRRTKRRR